MHRFVECVLMAQGAKGRGVNEGFLRELLPKLKFEG